MSCRKVKVFGPFHRATLGLHLEFCVHNWAIFIKNYATCKKETAFTHRFDGGDQSKT